MKINKLLFASLLSFLVLPQVGLANTFTVDPVHSSLLFKVNHLGFSDMFGQFKSMTGEFTIDDKNLKASKITFSAPTKSVETFNGDRDKHLRGPDFFNVKRFRELVFTSTKITKSGNVYKITGQLKMHGVSKVVSFDFTRGKTGLDHYKKFRTGGNAVIKIKRSDFGMNFMLKGIGDEITIFANLEGIKKAS